MTKPLILLSISICIVFLAPSPRALDLDLGNILNASLPETFVRKDFSKFLKRLKGTAETGPNAIAILRAGKNNIDSYDSTNLGYPIIIRDVIIQIFDFSKRQKNCPPKKCPFCYPPAPCQWPDCETCLIPRGCPKISISKRQCLRQPTCQPECPASLTKRPTGNSTTTRAPPVLSRRIRQSAESHSNYQDNASNDESFGVHPDYLDEGESRFGLSHKLLWKLKNKRKDKHRPGIKPWPQPSSPQFPTTKPGPKSSTSASPVTKTPTSSLTKIPTMTPATSTTTPTSTRAPIPTTTPTTVPIATSTPTTAPIPTTTPTTAPIPTTTPTTAPIPTTVPSMAPRTTISTTKSETRPPITKYEDDSEIMSMLSSGVEKYEYLMIALDPVIRKRFKNLIRTIKMVENDQHDVYNLIAELGGYPRREQLLNDQDVIKSVVGHLFARSVRQNCACEICPVRDCSIKNHPCMDCPDPDECWCPVPKGCNHNLHCEMAEMPSYSTNRPIIPTTTAKPTTKLPRPPSITHWPRSTTKSPESTFCPTSATKLPRPPSTTKSPEPSLGETTTKGSINDKEPDYDTDPAIPDEVDQNDPVKPNEISELIKCTGYTCNYQKKCGRALVNKLTPAVADQEGYMNGGEDSIYGEWPSFVRLKIENLVDMTSGTCAGVLITDRHILTVSHCLHFKKKDGRQEVIDAKAITAYIADYKTKTKDEHEIESSISNICASKNFFDFGGGSRHDFAVLKLDKPVKLNNYTQPACLPYAPLKPKTTKCFVVGMGIVKYNGPSNYKYADTLQKMELKRASCDKWGFLKDDRSRWCWTKAKSSGDTCQGDSGGPVLCLNEKKQWTVMGLVSYGSEECDGKTNVGWIGVYSRTRDLLKYIQEDCKI